MSFANTVEEHLRLTILRLLAADAEYTLNDSLITDLTRDYGFTPSRDNVRTQLSWLREQGLVSCDDHPGIIIATLSERGLDAAEGRARVPGVKRPSPGRR